MSEVTYIKGKDACLEESIERMQNILNQAGFEITEASWLNPVSSVFSVHIHDLNCPGLFTNGKGTSRKSTLASALGEFLERLASNYFFSDYWLEKQPQASNASWLYYPDEMNFSLDEFQQCLTPALWSFYDANQAYQPEDLLSLNDGAEFIRALPLIEQKTGEAVYFPMSLFSNIYASNGLSAGNTFLEAQVQGLSEVFERWVKNKIMRENICLPEIPDEIVNQFHDVVAARDALIKQGIELSMRDASLGGQFPVINVTLFEQKTGCCFASFGAHPIFEVALERTLTESLQGRQLGDLDGFQTPVFDEDAVAEDENIENHFIDSSGLIHARFISKDYDHEFTHWDFSGTTEQQWTKLLELVHEQGTDVYVGQYGHYGFPAVRLIVPGMSEIYPCEELVESNQNIGRELRSILLSMSADSDFNEILNEIDALGLSEHQGVASLIGLMPDPGSFWSQIQVSDLRFWVALSAQDHESAQEALQDVLYFVDATSERGVRYKAFEYALEMMLSEQVCESSLVILFGETLSRKVWQNIKGEEVFFNAEIGLNIFTQSQRHQAMLKIYELSREVKAGIA